MASDKLKQDLCRLIKTMCESGDGSVTFRESYSGRGMYGEKCVGIVGDRQDCTDLIAAVMKDHLDRLVDEAEFNDEWPEQSISDHHSIVDLLMDFKQDSMGYDEIIYWEGLTWEEDDHVDENEE